MLREPPLTFLTPMRWLSLLGLWVLIGWSVPSMAATNGGDDPESDTAEKKDAPSEPTDESEKDAPKKPADREGKRDQSGTKSSPRKSPPDTPAPSTKPDYPRRANVPPPLPPPIPSFPYGRA